jgi:hypothetical protein
MRAAVVVQDAGGKRLEVRDVAKPVPGESEVLVRVRTAGANRADLSMNVGHFRAAGAWQRPLPGSNSRAKWQKLARRLWASLRAITSWRWARGLSPTMQASTIAC